MDIDDEIPGGIQRADPLEHIGFESQRVIFPSGDLERIFAFSWMERNKDEWCILDRLLSTDEDPRGATQRDATVAATVVQWLGTNVGFGFVRSCLEKAGYEVKETPR